MTIDIARLDEKIRKLKQLRELAVDPDLSEYLNDLMTTNGNGNGQSAKVSPQSRDGLTDEVLKTAQGLSLSGFTVNDVFERMVEAKYVFHAKLPKIAIYDALRRLRDRGLVDVAREGLPGKPAMWKLTEAGRG